MAPFSHRLAAGRVAGPVPTLLIAAAIAGSMGRMANDPATHLGADPDEQHRAPRRKRGHTGLMLVALAAVGAAGWLWWQQQQDPAPAPAL
ncbi:MAG TPA: hypothetical protein VFE74_02150, partial [Ramlibacter sp.]|nr:hypothetical protein [Ramlibacter sp.]